MYPAKPLAGALAPAIAELVTDLISDVSREDSNTVDDYLDMVTTSPIIGPAADIKVLLACGMFGEYQHPDEEIQTWIRGNFETMRGSIKWSIAELSAVMPLGFACSEWSLAQVEGEWRLDRILALDPRKYRFRGRLGEVTEVAYQGATGEIFIPRDRLIHVTGRKWFSFNDPYGRAECRMAIACHKAWKIVLAEALIAAQRQGTGLVVGYSDSDAEVPLYGADGNPLIDDQGNEVRIPAPLALLNQLEQLENRSVLSTDVKNRIEVLGQSIQGDLFLNLLRLLQQYMLMSFLVPETVLVTGQSGSGDSNLNKGQRVTLNSVVGASLDQIKEEMLDSVIRALIVYNYGDRDDGYGSFATPDDKEQIDAATLLGIINGATQTGLFPLSDVDVVNRARELAGLPPVGEIAQQMSRRFSYFQGQDGLFATDDRLPVAQNSRNGKTHH